MPVLILLAIVMLGAMIAIVIDTIKEHRKPAVPFIDDDIEAPRSTLNNIHDLHATELTADDQFFDPLDMKDYYEQLHDTE